MNLLSTAMIPTRCNQALKPFTSTRAITAVCWFGLIHFKMKIHPSDKVVPWPGMLHLYSVSSVFHLFSIYPQIFNYSFPQIHYKIHYWGHVEGVCASISFGEPKYWVSICYLPSWFAFMPQQISVLFTSGSSWPLLSNQFQFSCLSPVFPINF